MKKYDIIIAYFEARGKRTLMLERRESRAK